MAADVEEGWDAEAVWRPIETAQKARKVIADSAMDELVLARWDQYGQCWRDPQGFLITPRFWLEVKASPYLAREKAERDLETPREGED